jgi:hypothetical protein
VQICRNDEFAHLLRGRLFPLNATEIDERVQVFGEMPSTFRSRLRDDAIPHAGKIQRLERTFVGKHCHREVSNDREAQPSGAERSRGVTATVTPASA